MAAKDRSRSNASGRFPHWVLSVTGPLNWEYSKRFYLNTGVIYWRDTPQARKLGELWHKNWLHYYFHTGRTQDQPAFNYSLEIMGFPFGVLNDKYNARVSASPLYAPGGIIYHFYHGVETERASDTILDELLIRYRASGVVDINLVSKAEFCNHPWVRDDQTAIVKSLVMGNYSNSLNIIWRKCKNGILNPQRSMRLMKRMLFRR